MVNNGGNSRPSATYPSGAELENRLGYLFGRPAKLDQALRHSSYAFERGGPEMPDNERLEFLGDAVLELVISDRLHRMLPLAEEGRLTAIRAGLVNERALTEVARRIELGDQIRLGRGEAASGGADKPSILSDCLEAVLGAVFLDGGFSAAREVINRLWSAELEAVARGRVPKDNKTTLQEAVQEQRRITPSYRLTGSRGPDHQRTFFAEVMVGDEVVGQGSGPSKKEAEQEAARQALLTMDDPVANGPEEEIND